jgi:hypothetical protein
VLEEGEVGPEDRLLPLERPHPDWPLARVLRIFYRDTLDRDGLAALAALAVLAPGWRDIAAKRLESGRVEDWRRRLEGRAKIVTVYYLYCLSWTPIPNTFPPTSAAP